MKTISSTYKDPQYMIVGFETEDSWNPNELKFYTVPTNLPQGVNHPISASIGKLGGTSPSNFIIYFNGFVNDEFITNGVQIGVRNAGSNALSNYLLQVQINVAFN